MLFSSGGSLLRAADGSSLEAGRPGQFGDHGWGDSAGEAALSQFTLICEPVLNELHSCVIYGNIKHW